MKRRIPIVRLMAVGAVLSLVGQIGIRPSSVLAQVSAPESARRIKPAAGLEAVLWASEPMVVNPTNIDVDSRGRVWVAEGLNYRLTRRGNQRFHRVEEADKIKILDDRVFPVPMGIAVEERYGTDGKYKGCRVFIGNSPDLLVLEDT